MRTAVGASAAAAVWGNAVVLVARQGGGEAVTLVAHPVAAAAGAAVLLRAGSSRGDLGLVAPSWRGRRAGAAKAGLAVVAAGVAALAAAALVHGGDGTLRLRVARLLVATAAGEEVIHRGLLLAVWTATGSPPRAVAAANAVTFAAWHVAGAVHGGSVRWVELAVPLAGTVPFLWARRRSGSVVPAAVLHAATNLPGLVARHW